MASILGRTRIRAVVFAAAMFAVPACGGRIPAPAPSDPLVVSKQEPPPEAQRIADVQAVDGSGCGIFGTAGSYEGALSKLRARARALGADFVQLTSVKEPIHDRQCAHKAFKVAGVAYRVRPPATAAPRAHASGAPVVPAVPAAQAEAQPRTANGSGLRLGATGCTFRASNSLQPASLTLSARLIAPAFALWIDESSAGATPNAFVLRYERASRRLEVVREPSGTVISVAAEPIEIDDAPHDLRLVRSAEEISVFLDSKRVLVTLARASTSESSFRLEPDQFEILRVSP